MRIDRSISSKSNDMIPVNEPRLGSRELEYVTECVREGFISSAGPFIEEFESEWATFCGMKHGIAVSSGTAALQVAVKCIDLQPGDEVIMPTFTIISCAMAVLEGGGMPVLVDCDPSTWCIDVGKVEARITERTRAIMPVHIYGHPVDMDSVRHLAQKYDLRIIEDAAEAHGAEYLMGRGNPGATWRRCGGLGDISTFSFYANKLVTTGEGGMVLTNDDAIAEKARSLRNLCFRPERRFYHTELGYNYRLTNLQAALGVAQIQDIDEIVAKKRWIGKSYAERLRDLSALQLPTEEPWAKNVYWMYGVVLHESTGMSAGQFAGLLDLKSVQTRPFFLGMHQQPVFTSMGLFAEAQYPIAERLSVQGLYLPSGLALSEGQLDHVCASVHEVLQ